MSFAGYLSQAELVEISKAITDAGLATLGDIQAMLSALNPRYAGAISASAKANTYLWNILQETNRQHNLRNGDVPLAQFLASAVALAGPTQAAELLEEKLEKISYAPVIAPIGATAERDDPGIEAEHVDVTPEAQTNAFDQTVSVKFLSDGIEAARSVVKILVHRHFNSTPEFLAGDVPSLVNGTAWFITNDLLITNHHVINARRKEGVAEPDATSGDFNLQAETATIQFDYLDGKTVPSELKLSENCLVHSDKHLDFAVLRIPEGAEGRPALKLRRFAMLKTPEQALGSRVNLLQHPNGKPMRLGFRNNYIVLGSDQQLAYLTDTAVGSSGSPVCDDSWAVAALHSGSRRITDQSVEILGHRYRRENFGVPIIAIKAHLESENPELLAEINAAQAV